jgi:hypothetical protein
MCHNHWYSIRNALEYTDGPSGMVADDAIARGSQAGGAILFGTTADVTVVRFATAESCHRPDQW